jgi:hypothetical protein
MSQRVNIQYSIDLDELPDEVDRLVDKFGDEIVTTSEIFSEMSPEAISISGLQSINDLRMSLARADHILDDVSKIISGYIRMNTSTQPEQEEQQVQNPFAPNAETLDGLEKKLKSFSDRMSNDQSTEVSNNQQ